VKTYKENPGVSKTITAEVKNGRVVVKIYERTIVLKYLNLEVLDLLSEYKLPKGIQKIFSNVYLKSLYQSVPKEAFQSKEDIEINLL